MDPVRGKVTFSSFYNEWSSRQVWVPGTVKAMNLATSSVTFSTVAMAQRRPSHLETWVKAMQDKPLAPGTIKTRFNNVRSVLRAAKRDKVWPTIRQKASRSLDVVELTQQWLSQPRNKSVRSSLKLGSSSMLLSAYAHSPASASGRRRRYR